MWKVTLLNSMHYCLDGGVHYSRSASGARHEHAGYRLVRCGLAGVERPLSTKCHAFSGKCLCVGDGLAFRQRAECRIKVRPVGVDKFQPPDIDAAAFDIEHGGDLAQRTRIAADARCDPEPVMRIE